MGPVCHLLFCLNLPFLLSVEDGRGMVCVFGPFRNLSHCVSVACPCLFFHQGGSHDRTTLLPLKAGVAIMALQGLAAGAEDVMIVPVGLIYHNPHKTQSRATIHIGDPIPVRHHALWCLESPRSPP